MILTITVSISSGILLSVGQSSSLNVVAMSTCSLQYRDPFAGVFWQPSIKNEQNLI